MTESPKEESKKQHDKANKKDNRNEEPEIQSASVTDISNEPPEVIKESDQERDEAPESSDPKDDLPSYEELNLEIVDLKDQLLRTVAESENVRRRTGREKADSLKYAITNFARSVLSVADNLSRALESVTSEARATSEDLENLCVGIEMTWKELDNVYEKFEITPIDALGKKFDHNLHQAMFEIDDPDQPAGVVVQQIQKGYMIHDRLLRPAMVGVSKGGLPLENEDESQGVDLEKLPKDTAAKETSSAYAKQAEATKQDNDTIPKVDKKL